MGLFWEPAALHIHVHVSDAEIIPYDEEKEGVLIAAAYFHIIQKVKNGYTVLFEAGEHNVWKYRERNYKWVFILQITKHHSAALELFT